MERIERVITQQEIVEEIGKALNAFVNATHSKVTDIILLGENGGTLRIVVNSRNKNLKPKEKKKENYFG